MIARVLHLYTVLAAPQAKHAVLEQSQVNGWHTRKWWARNWISSEHPESIAAYRAATAIILFASLILAVIEATL